MIFALFLALLILVPVMAEGVRRPVAVRRQDGVPGDLVPLSGGMTHIRRDGPKDGPVAVLIHGLTTPSYVYAGVVPALVAAGYRVIRYDLFGRGFSDRPLTRNDPAFFLRQLDDVLAHEGVEGPVVLVGYSMGGAIAAAKTARDPDAVTALAMIAPTGFRPAIMPKVTGIPVVGDWAMWVFGGHFLRRRMAGAPAGASVIPDLPDREAIETRTRGYLPSVLSSIRHTIQRDMSGEHRAIARAGVPVLAIWAGLDQSVPLSSMARLAELNPDAWHHQIDDADHGLVHNRPGEVGAEILRFLKARSGGAG